jgi:hypothetical protein
MARHLLHLEKRPVISSHHYLTITITVTTTTTTIIVVVVGPLHNDKKKG